jgi:hypothetical protein
MPSGPTLQELVVQVLAARDIREDVAPVVARDVISLVRQHHTASWQSTLNIWIARFRESQKALREVEEENARLLERLNALQLYRARVEGWEDQFVPFTD